VYGKFYASRGNSLFIYKMRGNKKERLRDQSFAKEGPARVSKGWEVVLFIFLYPWFHRGISFRRY
jgi:hypothetical protein